MPALISIENLINLADRGSDKILHEFHQLFLKKAAVFCFDKVLFCFPHRHDDAVTRFAVSHKIAAYVTFYRLDRGDYLIFEKSGSLVDSVEVGLNSQYSGKHGFFLLACDG